MKYFLRKIPYEIRYLIGNFLMLYACFLAFRVVFYLFFFQTNIDDSHAIVRAWYLGAKFDLRLALIVLLPVLLLLAVFRSKLFSRALFRKILLIYFFIIELCLLLVYIADFNFYGYTGRRIDPTILRFLNKQDAGINGRMLWESYPVIRELFFMVILMVVLFRLHRWVYRRFSIEAAARLTSGRIPRSRKSFWLPWSATLILMSGGIYGNFDYYPLQWSQALFSGDDGVSSLGLNPVLNFVHKLKFRQSSFDPAATRRYYPYMVRYLGIPHPDTSSLNFERNFPGDSTRPKPNIIFVMLESTGAAVSSMYGNPLQPTPNMKRLADSGILFENFYVPAHSTARTVYGLTTGIPDITQVETASRHPDMIDQRVIMNEFVGYEKYYLLGGNMNWANIRAVFTNNVKDVQLFEEDNFKDKKLDVWGISDYDLVREADRVFKHAWDRRKPFVAFLQLADNHRPYSTTPGAGDFRPWTRNEVDQQKLRASGFVSMGQLNALRYEDYNVGQLIRLAKKSGYLDHTVFVFFGDHNCLLNPYHFMPLPEYEMGTGQVHVTSFIYAPGFFKPRVITEPASLLDLYVTFARYVGLPFTNYTLGTDLFDSSRRPRYDFIWYRKNGQLCYGLMGSRYLYEMQGSTNRTALYDLQADPRKNVAAAHPATAGYLDHLMKGFYESAWYLMFNNRKAKKKGL